MPCTRPKQAWYARTPNPTGKFSVVYPKNTGPIPWNADITRPVVLPCQKCMECRLARSAKWALRCEHERSLHEESCFITLTYRTEDLPEGGTLVKKDFQDFLKRLRRLLGKQKIRYYMCGEYGEKRGRPHYHAIIFGANFHDRKVVGERNGITYYESATINERWGLGGTQIGDANFETAAYCARYITKKLTGKRAAEYQGKLPEYNEPSRKPGIAKTWIEQNYGDVYPKDEIKLNGRSLRPPKFYDDHYEVINPERMATIKERRKQKAENNKLDRKRLKTMEQIAGLKNKKLQRGYENG